MSEQEKTLFLRNVDAAAIRYFKAMAAKRGIPLGRMFTRMVNWAKKVEEEKV